MLHGTEPSNMQTAQPKRKVPISNFANCHTLRQNVHIKVTAIPASYFGGLDFETQPLKKSIPCFFFFFLRFYELQEIITFKRILMLSHIFQLIAHKNHFNATGNVRINAILGRIRVTVTAVENQ